MNRSDVERLGIDPKQALRNADFYESYARLMERDVEQSETALMEMASALRDAGQWAMPVDRERGEALLTQAGSCWHQLGHGFGSLLLTAFAPALLSPIDLQDRLAQLLDYLRGAGPGSRGVELPHALTFPQQQVYLVIAAACVPGVELPEDLVQISRWPQHAQGVTPVGALGTPIRAYWRIADALFNGNAQVAARLVVEQLAKQAAAYGERIELGRTNKWLWSHGAAPVDLVDLDILSVGVSTARKLGPNLVHRQIVEHTAGLPDLAQLAMSLPAEAIKRVPGFDQADPNPFDGPPPFGLGF